MTHQVTATLQSKRETNGKPRTKGCLFMNPGKLYATMFRAQFPGRSGRISAARNVNNTQRMALDTASLGTYRRAPARKHTVSLSIVTVDSLMQSCEPLSYPTLPAMHQQLQPDSVYEDAMTTNLKLLHQYI